MPASREGRPAQGAAEVVAEVADTARHVAPGGWRRMIVGLAVGMGFGAVVARFVDPDRDPDRDPPQGR